jgi:hypothetical protein
MPDLTVHTVPVCLASREWVRMVPSESIPGTTYRVEYGETFNPRGVQRDYSCTCPSYVKNGGQKYCKHINAVRKDRCRWNSHMEPYAIPADHKCPECGGPLVFEKVAV